MEEVENRVNQKIMESVLKDIKAYCAGNKCAECKLCVLGECLLKSTIPMFWNTEVITEKIYNK